MGRDDGGDTLGGVPGGPQPEEQVTELLAAPGLRVERIVSTGQASPPGLWYDQDRAEWVLVLSGSAGLLFEGEDGPRVLGPGDHVLIPARAGRRLRHSPGLRVELLTEGNPHGKPVWAGQGGDGVGHRVPRRLGDAARADRAHARAAHPASRGPYHQGGQSMKGMVFTELLEMVEDKFSPEMADQIIEQANLRSGGIYTSVGTYDHNEMIELVYCLSKETGIPPAELVQSFGTYLFGRFRIMFPSYFEGISSSFGFLQRIEDYIHVEVRKLYPEAELPSFACDTPEPGCLRLTYRSTRPFAALAEGLIRGCIDHYGEAVDIETEDLSDGTGTAARFLLTRRDAPP